MYRVKNDFIPYEDRYIREPFELRVEREALEQEREQRVAKVEMLNLQLLRSLRDRGVMGLYEKMGITPVGASAE